VLIALFFFVADFVSYAVCHQWVTYSLCIWYILFHLRNQSQARHTSVLSGASFFVLLLTLLQNYFLYGRFGLGLLSMLPVLLLARISRPIFLKGSIPFFHCLLVGLFLMLEFVVIQKWVLGAPSSTMATIFGSIIVAPVLFFACYRWI